MSKRKSYKDPKPKVKCPKNHEIDEDAEGTFYLRLGPLSARVEKDTPYRHKMRNLLELQVMFWQTSGEIDEGKFCSERGISTSNYRRLIALVKYASGEDDGSGNSVPDTPTTRKQMLVLNLHEQLCDCGVDMQTFCKQNNISRATFFRYLSDIEDYVAARLNQNKGWSHLTLTEEGDYRIFPPYDY